MNDEVVLEIRAETNIGRVRELNEDHFITTNDIYGSVWSTPDEVYSNVTTGTVMAIADGMGGQNAGEVASKIAIDTVKKYFNAIKISQFNKKFEILNDCILDAHNSILRHASINKETSGMGTTLIIAWIVKRKLYVCWSGDSRCYLYRQSLGLKQISKDHSYVQTLVDNGKLTKEQSFYHPQSNIVLQSLGNRDENPEPDVIAEPLHKEDIILMCSDGLNGMLTDSEIEEIITSKKSDLNICANKLVEKANQAGGKDNITIILGKVYDEKLENRGKLNAVKSSSRDKNNRKLKWFLMILLIVTFIGSLLFFIIYERSDKKVIKKKPDKPIPGVIL